MFQFNNFIYPRPASTYDRDTFAYETDLELIWVQSAFPTAQAIPCLHLKSSSDQFLLYFHGNAEDLGSTFEFLITLRAKLAINILAMEYPGYGVYSGQTTEETINQDAESVYIYIQLHYKIPESKLMVFGRSIGTGPACQIASLYNPKALILMSPFSSVQAVAKQHLKFFALLLKDQFDNITKAARIHCPTLVIHGKSDKLIPYEQADRLYKSLASLKKMCHYPELMTHNDFHFTLHLELPIKDFVHLLSMV